MWKNIFFCVNLSLFIIQSEISSHLALEALHRFYLNSLPSDKILGWSKLKASTVAKINVAEEFNYFRRFSKHRGKKEKMLVTSIFSFSHDVYKMLLSQGH